ncbi:MAG: SurA N-terminal domain-containing protein [Bdellovibrionales bacterium]|nr:SurA N-terminal domain-containing protein [Bdellovibrionales bacterium]
MKLVAIISMALLCFSGRALAEDASLLPEPLAGGALSSDEPTPRALAPREIVLDMVLATVDGEPLSASDLRRHILAQGGTPPESFLDPTPETQRYLRELVAERMLAKEAEDSGITVADDEIEAYIDEIKRQNQVDSDGFNSILANRGLTYDEYVAQVRNDIVRARVMAQKVRAKVNVLDVDVERYLKERPELLPEQGSVRLQQVFIAANPQAEDRELLRARMGLIRDRLTTGAPWQEIAGEYYTDLGYVDPSELRGEIRDAIRDLEPGAISDIVETPQGVYIFAATPAGEGLTPDSKFKEEIRKELFEARFKEEVNQFLNTELPKKYHVEMKI